MKTIIPLWINILQCLLILILLQQTYLFYFDHEAVRSSGIKIDGVPDFNLIYEFAGRTVTMAIVSIFIMYSQNVKLFIVMFLMNLLREIQETIIDPLFPLTTAPLSPTGDLVAHIVIVVIELIAFIKLYKISKELRGNDA
jgi:hypothetical protein